VNLGVIWVYSRIAVSTTSPAVDYDSPTQHSGAGNMQKVFYTNIDMSGYLSGETDFQPAFDRAVTDIPGFADAFQQNIMAPLTSIAQNTGQSGVLTVLGYADRVDTPGLGREDIRNQEFAAGVARAVSSKETIFTMLNTAVGGTLGTTWADVVNITVVFPSLGAANLINSDSGLTEAQRQRNRRVLMFVTQFIPELPVGGLVAGNDAPDVDVPVA
jgi:hypothetical protein